MSSAPSSIRKSNSNPTNLLMYLLFLFYIAWKTMPIVSYYSNTYIAMVILVVLFLSVIVSCRLRFEKFPQCLFASICYILFYFINQMMLYKHGVFYAVWDVFTVAFPLITGFLLITQADRRFVRRLANIIVVLYLITALTTYIGTLAFPQASREMTADPLAYHRYYPYNIGSFGFVYSLVLLHPVIVFFLRIQSKLWPAVLFSVISGLCVFKSDFAIGVLLFVASCIVYLLPLDMQKASGKRRIGWIVVFLLIALILLPVLLRWMSQWSIFGEISEKLADVANLLQGKETENADTALRQEVYSKSWSSFLESPLVGNVLLSKRSVGGHSYFLDLLSDWGLIGFLVALFFLTSLWKMYRALTKKQAAMYVVALFLVMAIVLMILNPTFWSFEFGFAVPIFVSCTVSEGEKNENCTN